MVIDTDCTGSCKSGFSKYYPLLEVYKFRVVNLKKVFFSQRSALLFKETGISDENHRSVGVTLC